MPERYSKKSSTNKKHALILDIGTTGVKAFVFDWALRVVAQTYQPLPKYYPKNEWVEQDPNELLRISQKTLKKVVKASHLPPESFVGLGITNQRETTICWDKKTGKTVYPAIVWEDKRTKNLCANLGKKFNGLVRKRTGLLIDPYFSATKIGWILQNAPAAKRLAAKERLAFGTVDSWILWNFLDAPRHFTDYTNASRTLLFNIKSLKWDKQLLDIFSIPLSVLPEVKPSQSFFGNLKKPLLGFTLPVLAVCGDQQASMYAAGVAVGTTKITYGTGTFVMQSIGKKFILRDSFFTTIIPNSKLPLYALEMKIESTGKKIQECLNKKLSLDPLLKIIVKRVAGIIRRLPVSPNKLIVDGGITRAKHLIALQREASLIKVQQQKVADGTALGTAKLIRDHH